MKEKQGKEYFRQERREVESAIPRGANRILDVGCGEGILGRRLLETGVSEVVGIELSRDAGRIAGENISEVICGDVENIDLPFKTGYFDCIIFADILEHLKDPLTILERFKEKLSDSGTVVASIPNVGYFGVIDMLTQGRWKYQDHGILDETHLRFFTRKEIEILFADAGFQINGITANVSSAYKSLNDPFTTELSFGRVTLSGLTPEEVQDLFVIQYIIRAEKAGHELSTVYAEVNAAIESGDFRKAKKVIDGYLELHSVDMEMRYRHAEVCRRLGLHGEAEESLRKILLFNPDNSGARELMSAVRGNGDSDSSQKSSIGRIDAGNAEKQADSRIKKIAVVRGANLNKWEMQNYEPLMDSYDITAYTTSETYFDVSGVSLPFERLPFRGQGLLLEMQGLEDRLADKDLIFSADITFKFSAQAIDTKQKYGNKVVCLEWENIPFNYEEYEVVHDIKEKVRKGADHFIAVTGRAKEALMLEGVPEEKINVIPMGVDLTTFRPVKGDVKNDRLQLGINSDDIVVLFIGRMVWEKGIYDFIHAAAGICRDSLLKDYPVKFLAVGKGPELQGVRERAAMLGISTRIIFLEEYPYMDMYKLHNLADIFVLPSISTLRWQEQFGMVLIESMACGTPVVSTLSGSIPEVVGDAGILVRPHDHASLCSAIKGLITDSVHREDLGSRALLRAQLNYDSRKIAERVRKVFEKVLTKRTKEDVLRDIYTRGINHWERGDKEKGFEMLRLAFKEDPDRKETLDSIVQKGMEMEKYEIVEESLREYLSFHPAGLEALLSLAETLMHLGRPDKAEVELKKVFIFDPDNSSARLVMDEIKKSREKITG